MLIPRIIEASLFLLIIVMVNKKFKGFPILKRPVLHQAFLLGICGWFVYIFIDIFIYTFAAKSFNETMVGTYEGYTKDHPSLFVANIFRDMAIIGMQIETWAYFFLPIIISKGGKKAIQILKKPWVLITIISLSAMIVINDVMVVEIRESNIVIREKYNGIHLFSILFAIFIYFYAAIRLFITLSKTTENESKVIQKRSKKLGWGVLVIGLGYLWAIIWNAIAVFIPELYENKFIFLFVSIIIHLLWTLSPILLYQSLFAYDKKKEERIPVSYRTSEAKLNVESKL